MAFTLLGLPMDCCRVLGMAQGAFAEAPSRQPLGVSMFAASKSRAAYCVEAYFKLNTLDLENDRPKRDGPLKSLSEAAFFTIATDPSSERYRHI